MAVLVIPAILNLPFLRANTHILLQHAVRVSPAGVQQSQCLLTSIQPRESVIDWVFCPPITPESHRYRAGMSGSRTPSNETVKHRSNLPGVVFV